MTFYSEIVDSPESAKKFIELNKIKEGQLKLIIVVWEEKDDS